MPTCILVGGPGVGLVGERAEGGGDQVQSAAKFKKRTMESKFSVWCRPTCQAHSHLMVNCQDTSTVSMRRMRMGTVRDDSSEDGLTLILKNAAELPRP